MVLYVINCLCSNDTCNHWDTERPKVPVKLGNMEEVSALSVCVMGYNLTVTSTHAPIQCTTSFLNIDGCYGFHGYNPTICVIFNKIESEVHS